MSSASFITPTLVEYICIRRPLPCATKATSNELVFCLLFFIFAFCSSRPTVVMNGVAARNGLTAEQWTNPSTEKQVKKKKHRTEDSSRAGDRGLVADDAMSRSSWLLFRHPSESEWGAGHTIMGVTYSVTWCDLLRILQPSCCRWCDLLRILQPSCCR